MADQGGRRERSVVFRQDEVQATLEGRKTQFRRPLAIQPPTAVRSEVVGPFGHLYDEPSEPDARGNRESKMWTKRCPFGAPGQPLWVRETWGDAGRMYGEEHDTPQHVAFFADKTALVFPWGNPHPEPGVPIPDWDRKSWGWAHIRRRSATTLPRWAARLFLRVTSVQVRQLQSITDDEARAEGRNQREDGLWLPGPSAYPSWALRTFWDRQHGVPEAQAWQANPWLWLVEFEVTDVLTRPKPRRERVVLC